MADTTVTLTDEQRQIVIEALEHLFEDADNDSDAEEVAEVARVFGVELI